jgi:PAS domain S-box-containing protein
MKTLTPLKTLLLGKDNRIARRLIVLIIAFSSLITLLISTVQLAFEYTELRSGMERTLDDVNIFVPSVSGSVWNFDEVQIRLTLDALKQLPTVERVAVSSSGRDQHWSVGEDLSSHVVTRSYSLRQRVRGLDSEIGTLTIFASLDAIYRQLAASALTIILSNGMKTFFVALFMIFLFRRLVTSRLEQLAGKVGRMKSDLFPNEYVNFENRPRPSHLDELDSVDWMLDNAIEEFKRAEQAMRLSEEKFSKAFHSNPDWVVLSRRDTGEFLDVNEGFEQISGYSRQEALGRTSLELGIWADPLARELAVRQLKEHGSVSNYEALFIDKTGGQHWMNCSFNEIDLPGAPCMIGVLRDVTEHKRAQAQIQSLNKDLERRVAERTIDLEKTKEEAEQANRAKSEFLSSMSHELRTPLNAILGYSQLMQLSPELPRDILEHAREINQAGAFLLGVINDILDLARIESGRLDLRIEPIGLEEVMQECMSQNMPSAAERGITLQCDETSAQWRVLADWRRLVQVVNNLMSNAIKYNREGGQVSVACRAGAAKRARITVTDTGVGLSPQQQAQLFQPFNRLGAEMGQTEGTGIGLSIALRLVAAMDGRIGVESAPDQGSTFWIDLPAAVP